MSDRSYESYEKWSVLKLEVDFTFVLCYVGDEMASGRKKTPICEQFGGLGQTFTFSKVKKIYIFVNVYIASVSFHVEHFSFKRDSKAVESKEVFIFL